MAEICVLPFTVQYRQLNKKATLLICSSFILNYLKQINIFFSYLSNRLITVTVVTRGDLVGRIKKNSAGCG
jgi:hypothetical protein